MHRKRKRFSLNSSYRDISQVNVGNRSLSYSFKFVTRKRKCLIKSFKSAIINRWDALTRLEKVIKYVSLHDNNFENYKV